MLMKAMWSCSALYLERSLIPDFSQPDLILSISVAKSLRFPELQLVLPRHDHYVGKQAIETWSGPSPGLVYSIPQQVSGSRTHNLGFPVKVGIQSSHLSQAAEWLLPVGGRELL